LGKARVIAGQGEFQDFAIIPTSPFRVGGLPRGFGKAGPDTIAEIGYSNATPPMRGTIFSNDRHQHNYTEADSNPKAIGDVLRAADHVCSLRYCV
jgi:hypothetical protein